MAFSLGLFKSPDAKGVPPYYDEDGFVGSLWGLALRFSWDIHFGFVRLKLER